MRTITVKDTTQPRLDAYLLAQFPALSSGRLFKFLRENKIKLNGKKAPLTTPLQKGDVIKLFVQDELLTVNKDVPLFMQAKKHFDVVFEDDEVLLADKPAGLPCMDEAEETADTLINRALRYLAENGTWTPRSKFTPCLCHRLDTGTSGLILIAKSAAAFNALTEMIKSRSMIKKYLCVTVGHPAVKNDTLKGYLNKDAEKGKVQISTVKRPGSKDVITKYRTLAVSGRLALLEVELVTGRTHQIRAHMASIGCPILGDSKYGINTVNRSYKTKYQTLCAYSLAFPVIAQGPLQGLSQKTFHVQKPWYVKQILDHTLE